MKRTLVVWRRLGREHGLAGGLQKNTDDVVAAHVESKVDAFRDTPDYDWRWWQANERVLVERPFASTVFSDDSIIYYLPERHWVLVQNVHLPNDPQESWYVPNGHSWQWYVHIGAIEHRKDLRSWVFTDLFADVVIARDGRTHTVLDLDDLALGMQMGLVDGEQVQTALSATQKLLDLIRAGEFPPREIRGLKLDVLYE